jgi:thiosulfate/3-mercaptopyruvate sulfurtransferase
VSYSTLVSGEVLAAHLTDPQWRVFDCRHQLADATYGEQAYAQGHLPGAVFLHLDRDLSSPMNGRNGRHPLPEPQPLADRLGAAGVSSATQVVVYDDAGGMVAGRLWWLLRWLGHDRVALLDGGINQWIKEGRPLSAEVPKPAPAVLAIEPRDWVVGADAVLANIDEQGFAVIDARAPDRFRGENETIDPVGGHIPGALNRFFRDNLDANGLFRPAAELRREYLALLAGRAPEQAVMQCGSGVSACHNILAMEIAGLPGAKLYAGSWSEWCSDPARPVAR